MMIASRNFAIALLSVLIVPAWTSAGITQDDNPLAGNYEIVSGRDGTLPIDPERLNGRVQITADRMTIYDQDDKEVYVVDYELEGRESPYKVAMKTVRSPQEDAEGSTALGLLKREGDTVTLIYHIGAEKYPTDFLPQAQGEHRFVLKRTGSK